MTAPAIEASEVRATHTLIAPYIRRTPVLALDPDEFGLGAFTLHAKLELLQHAGSFKTHGAFANLLARELPAAGVLVSGGNGAAVVLRQAQDDSA